MTRLEVGLSEGWTTMTGAALSPARRMQDLERLRTEHFDILVVGGGITGAGTALDAVTRGLRVALVEAQDWAAGTSSRSSKLVHGGLRYLQMFDFHLVREALKERSLLLTEIAPHLVHPIPFLYPLRTPVIERAYVGAGIALYDAMAWSTGTGRGLPLHRHLSRRGALALAPGLRADSLAGAIEYYDAQVDDARYVVETVRTAAGFGVAAVSRAAAVGFLRQGDRVSGARVRDNETGVELEVGATATILATGPWTEDTEAIAGRVRAMKVRPSKGVHLVVPRAAVASTVALVVRTARSVLFVLPWGEHWIVGTTDTEWDDDKARPVATAADVDYLLGQVNQVLGRPLRREDVEATYAGLRPLVAGVGVVRGPGEQGAERIDRMAHEADTTKVSREHAVSRPSPGLVVVSGGKYTTYRVMAADAVDAALDGGSLGVRPSMTARVRLAGAEGYEVRKNQTAAMATRYGLAEAVVVHLVRRYGGLVDEVLALVDADPSLGAPVEGSSGYIKAEVLYAVTHEGARHLEDVLLRRTRIGIETPDSGRSAAEGVAAVMAGVLGWDRATIAAEAESYALTAALEYAADGRPADDAEAARRAKETPPLLPLP